MGIHIRDIAKMDVQEVIDTYNEQPGIFRVMFDDGELEHNSAEIVFTRFILNYWNALPKDFQILKRYSIAFKREMNPHTPLHLCSLIYEDYVNEYEFTEYDIDDNYQNRVVYKDVINALYNFHVQYLTKYIQGANSLDLIEILNHPPIRDSNQKLLDMKHDPTPKDIADNHNIIKYELLNSPAFKDNQFALYRRCGVSKELQMCLIVGAIGYVTDVGSTLFPHPLRNGFYHGNAQMWEMGIESRNASRAELYNELIIPQSQYTNRRVQFHTHSIRYIARSDCGTRRYKSTFVTDKAKLNAMRGLWRYDPTTDKLVNIRGDEKELVGTTIQHRSITKCAWSTARSEKCAVCYGRLYRALTEHPIGSPTNIKGRNPGHVAAITFGGPLTSGVLATKHATSTSVATKLDLGIDALAYVRLSEDGKFIMFHSEHRKLNQIKLKLFREQVEKLYDMKNGLIDMSAPSVLTFVENFTIIDTMLDEGFQTTGVVIGSKQRAGHLTLEAIEYICDKGWEFDEARDLIIDLSDWKENTPFFIIPQIELSPPEFIEGVTGFMLGRTAKRTKNDIVVRRLDSYNNIDEAIDALYYELSERMNINYTHLSVIVLALSAQDPDAGDFRIPYPPDSGKVATETPLLFNSSAGMQMAYEMQHRILSSPQSFVLHKRKGHPLDSLLLSRVYGNRKNPKV